MKIVKKLLDPSRPDAMRLRRDEKMAMLHMMYAVTIFEDLQKDIEDRLRMVPDGRNRMAEIAQAADRLLYEVRVTIPENQRMSLQNTAKDYEIRLTPKATPEENNVIMTKEEFRELVDCARTKCKDCTLDDHECEECELYRLLTSVLPMSDYHDGFLCVYNLGEWAN